MTGVATALLKTILSVSRVICAVFPNCDNFQIVVFTNGRGKMLCVCVFLTMQRLKNTRAESKKGVINNYKKRSDRSVAETNHLTEKPLFFARFF